MVGCKNISLLDVSKYLLKIRFFNYKIDKTVINSERSGLRIDLTACNQKDSSIPM